MNRFWVRHEECRKNSDGSYSIHCRLCGREIMRQNHPIFLSVTKCALCVLKAQGVVNAEDYVLAQYRIPTAPGSLPIPVDIDDSMAAGVLLLNPEEKLAEGEPIPQLGVIGTIKSMFRTVGFMKPKPEEVPQSVKIATERRSGLFGPQKGRR